MSDTTVFVIGAGASYELSGEVMPLGAGLASEIETSLQESAASGYLEGAVASALMRNPGLGETERVALNRLQLGIKSCDSIDEFVDQWGDVPRLPEIAKLCIADRILAAERRTGLAKASTGIVQCAHVLRELRETWLGFLVRRMNQGVSRRRVEESFEGISFIIFNYDRMIEFYIINMLINTLGVEQGVAFKIVDDLHIDHVYGSLGAVYSNGISAVEYGAAEQNISRASSSIRTFTEEQDSVNEQVIRTRIRAAKRIVFLGCAYHPRNLEALFGGSVADGVKIFGTAVGMRSQKVEQARGYFASIGSPLLHFEDCDCRNLLVNRQEQIFD